MTITHNLAKRFEGFVIVPNIGVLPCRGIRFQAADTYPTLTSKLDAVDGSQLFIGSKVCLLYTSDAADE